MKERNHNHRVLYVIIGILIFAIGVTIGKLIDWGYFILNKEISIIEALSLFATIGAAIYIANVLEKEVQDKRNEKDLLLKRSEEISKKIDDCLDTISVDNIPFFKVTHGIQRLTLSIRYVLEAIARSKKTFESDLGSTYMEDIRFLRQFLTDTPKGNSTNPDLSIENDLIRISPRRQILIEMKLEELKNKLFVLQIEINRM